MVIELLSPDYSVAAIDTSGRALVDTQVRARKLEEQISAHDGGFFGALGAAMLSSAVLHSMAQEIITPDVRMDARDYDGDYDWRQDAEQYEGLYPREIFIGSHSGEQSRRAMARYDGDMYRSMAVSRRPVAAFLGNMVGFGMDLFALKSIPFIGGLSSAGARSLSSKIGNSILRGAVADSIAFSLDVSEVELARVLMDERVTMGGVIEHLPEEIMYSALLGGTLGLVGGAVKGRKLSAERAKDLVFKEKIVEQIRGGTQLSGADGARQAGQFANQLASQYYGRLKDAAPSVTADQLDNFISVVGGVEEHSVTTAPAKNVLCRLAVDPTTRAYGSAVPLVRDMAKLLHDNHLLQDTPVQSLDISVRVRQNELQGRAKLLLDDGYEKLIADRNNYSIDREEFNRLVGSTLTSNGKLPAGYDPQFAHHVEESAARFIREIRGPVQDAYIAMKKKQAGAELVKKSEEAVGRARERVATLASKRASMGLPALESNVKRGHESALNSAQKGGIYRPIGALARARAAAINDLNRRYDALVDGANKYAFEQLSAIGERDILADMDLPAAGLEKGRERLLARINKSREHALARVDREYGDLMQRSEQYYGDTLAKVRRDVVKRTFQLEDEYAAARGELAEEERLLGERMDGSFASDVAGWLQDNDDGYTHRMYDYGKILSQPEAFIGDVSKKLVALEGLNTGEAHRVARGLYEELLTTPVGRKYISRVQLRGATQHRYFLFSSDVVANWLDTDAQRMAEHWANTVIPDSILMDKIGTFQAKTFENEIKEQIVALVDHGGHGRAGAHVPVSGANELLHESVEQVQRMIDNIRGLNYAGGGALWSRKAWQASAALRSLQSIVSLGGLVYTSLFDAASTILNKGVFRTLAHDGTTMLKYLSSKAFRKGLREHPDLIAMSGWLDVLLRKDTNRTLADHGIAVNYLTRVNTFLRAAERMQMKITGAEAVFNSLHMAADYGNMLTLSAIGEKVAAGQPLTLAEKNILNIARVSGEQAGKIGEMVRLHGEVIGGIKHVNAALWDDGAAAHALHYGVNALTKNGILTPGMEVPPFMRTPLGEVLFQYKKFIVSAVDRCLLPALGRLSVGEMRIIGALLAMISIGGLKEVLSRLGSGRNMLTFNEFWEYGVGNCDALPLIGELFKDAAHGFNSRGLSGALDGAKNWLRDFFLPPVVGTAARALTGMNGVSAIMAGKRDHLTNSEIAAIKASIPYNNTIYLNRLLNKLLRHHVEQNDVHFNINY
jgi:ParB-like chromosome segregation protein Spo0J